MQAQRGASKLVYPDSEGKLVYATDSAGQPVIPEFSYAGYHAGEKSIPHVTGPVFDVTDFGAVPDDGADDQEAIQKAINAAEEAGGGVVFFPPGTYQVNSDLYHRQPLRIRTGNIVLRGSGGWLGGTQILIVHPTIQVGPKLIEPMGGGWLQVGMLDNAGQPLTRLTKDTERNQSIIEVEDASHLAAGMWISLRVKSKEIVPDVISPYTMTELSPLWTRIQQDGLSLVEHHLIQAVEGNRVLLREPVKIQMKALHGWTVTTYDTIAEVGIEDICFQGAWIGNFYHHRSVLDDSGWEAVKFNNSVNSWVRRCTFINLNSMVNFEASSYCSVLHLEMSGAMGHSTIGTPRRCTGMLVGLCKESSHQSGKHTSHSIGSAGSGVGHVFWRYTMHPDQAFDMHGMFPYATLFDRVTGGDLTTTGGPNPSFPNHLKDFVVWNFEHVKEPRYRNPAGYDFWTAERPKVGRPNIVKPVIVGMHGVPVKFVESTVGVIDSMGQAVEPESLFEAQLVDRLGGLPDWVSEAKREWEELQQLTLPAFARGGEYTQWNADKRTDTIRYILESGNGNVWSPLKDGDPIRELIAEWPAGDGSPWPPYISSQMTGEGTVAIRLAADEGCTIRYTLDGSEPNENSAVYTDPIELRQDTTVQAVAFKQGHQPSFVSTCLIRNRPLSGQ